MRQYFFADKILLLANKELNRNNILPEIAFPFNYFSILVVNECICRIQFDICRLKQIYLKYIFLWNDSQSPVNKKIYEPFNYLAL